MELRGVFALVFVGFRFTCKWIAAFLLMAICASAQAVPPQEVYASVNYPYWRSLPHMLTDPTEECHQIYEAFGTWSGPNGQGFYVCTYGLQFAGIMPDANHPGDFQCMATPYLVSGDLCTPSATQPIDELFPNLVCPAGTAQGDPSKQQDPGDCVRIDSCKECAARAGNPIDTMIGSKDQTETDYRGNGPFPMVVQRTYSSGNFGPGRPMGGLWWSGLVAPIPPYTWTSFSPPAGWTSTQTGGNYYWSAPGVQAPPIPFPVTVKDGIGSNWRLSYDRTVTTVTGSQLYANLYRPDNQVVTFTFLNGLWVPNAGKGKTALTQQNDSSGNLLGFTYVNENDEVEKYDATGTLQSITNRAGLTQTLHYATTPADGATWMHLQSVTDDFGRTLTFNYDSVNARITGFVDPNGGTYTYNYDSNNNFVSVTYADGNTRQYAYENTTFVQALTGLIDENGARFATWSYDGTGNAITSEHAGGVENVQVNYSGAPTNTTVTSANGSVKSFASIVVGNYARPSTITETCGAGANCQRQSSTTYDADGNIATSTDDNGNITTYSYDLTRDLETSRTEASNTPQARTITTQWHPQYRLPVQITEPGRTTTFTYDTSGNLLTKTVSANGSNRVWTYTYNTYGQVLTSSGPRTDVNDTSTYAYDGQGNLSSITNALGQVTTFSNYDPSGRVGLITDPNGQTTALTYSPRGWLTNKVVTAGSIVQTTSYAYDNAGQLIKVTLPDNTTISYTYDPAHRLTNIWDSLGNSINYSLDLMSNRVGETVNDPNGVLTRQVSRVYDGFNRIKQVIGAAQ